MDEPLRELARRDAKAIRGGIIAVGAALVLGVIGLFTPALVFALAAAKLPIRTTFVHRLVG